MGDGDVWYFDRLAPIYDWLVTSADVTALEQGIAHATEPVEHVLDLGGGTGRAARAITAPRRTVIDISRRMLRRVPAVIASVQANAASLPIRDESIDAVLLVDTLHHFSDADAALSEVARILRPGGVVVVQEFDRASILGRLVAGFEHLIGMNSRFYTIDELDTILEAVGLTSVVLETSAICTVIGRKPLGEPGKR